MVYNARKCGKLQLLGTKSECIIHVLLKVKVSQKSSRIHLKLLYGFLQIYVLCLPLQTHSPPWRKRASNYQIKGLLCALDLDGLQPMWDAGKKLEGGKSVQASHILPGSLSMGSAEFPVTFKQISLLSRRPSLYDSFPLGTCKLFLTLSP